MRQANTTFVDLRSRARRRRPAGERVEAGGEEAAAVPRELRPLAQRRPADRPRPQPRSSSRTGADNDLDRPQPHLPAAGRRARHEDRSVDAGGGAKRRPVRARSPRAPRRSRTRAPIIGSAGPTRPTCSAGSTTSRPPAATTRSAASRARRRSSTRFDGPRRRAAAGDRRRSTSAQRDCSRSAGSRDQDQYKRCPGASEEPAPDGSNVLSAEPAEGARTASSPTRAGNTGRADEARHLHTRSWSWRCAGAVVLERRRRRDSGPSKTVKIAFDNAFGLTEGGDLRVGGVQRRADRRSTFEGRCHETERGRPTRLRSSRRRSPSRASTSFRTDATLLDPPAVADRRVLRRLPARARRRSRCRTTRVPIDADRVDDPADLVARRHAPPLPRAAAADHRRARHRPGRPPART